MNPKIIELSEQWKRFGKSGKGLFDPCRTGYNVKVVHAYSTYQILNSVGYSKFGGDRNGGFSRGGRGGGSRGGGARSSYGGNSTNKSQV